MFSPEATLQPAASTRGNRRRKQRDESLQLPKAKRQRSALKQDTFQPLENVNINELGGPVDGDVGIHSPMPEEKAQSNGAGTTKQLSLRGRNEADRGDSREGAVALSSNDYYEVTQLPSLPDQLRPHPQGASTVRVTSRSSLTDATAEAYHTHISPEHGYVLALKHDEAFAWPYNSTSSTPISKDLYTFQLRPHIGRRTNHLPLGAFTSKAVGSEPGLVVVFPENGEVLHWESLTNASTPAPGTVSGGIRGKVPGMLSGELATELVSAEPSGFVLAFSTGRVAHISLKDPHGKAAVGVNFLRGQPGNGSAVWNKFGSIFGASAWRKDVVAIHAGASAKGQREVVIASSDGNLEFWDTRLSTGHTLKAQANVSKEVIFAIQQAQADVRLRNEHEHHMRVLDFAFNMRPRGGNALVVANQDHGIDLLMLVSLPNQESTSYFLVELTVTGDSSIVHVVHPITCYKGPQGNSKSWPRLSLPKPGLTAFVVFDTAVVLFSLKRVEESPDAQLLMESQLLPQPFQDCVQFREGIYRVLGHATEDKTDRSATVRSASIKNPGVALAVQGFGLVRVAATAAQTDVETTGEPKVTAKSKLEQAVFFGHLASTPLNLLTAQGQLFSAEETEKAALELSQEILSSQSRYVKEMTTMDMQLKIRAKALQDLATHISENGPPLSRSVRWKLLQGAERLAAQQAMWKVEEDHMKHKRHDSRTLLDKILWYVPEITLSVSDPKKGEHDQVRQWFKHDTWRIQYVLPWLCNVMIELRKDGMKDDRSETAQISDGVELCLAMLTTAFRFRENNAALYGFEEDTFEKGVLASSYAQLSEPWTSQLTSCEQIQKLLTITLNFCDDRQNSRDVDHDVLNSIRDKVPLLCLVVDQMATEHERWAAVQSDEQIRANGEKLYEQHLGLREDQMHTLVKLELFEEALGLAEDLSDMESLVDVLEVQKVKLLVDLEQKRRTKEQYDGDMNAIEEMEDAYLDKHGDRFANAFFSGMVAGSQLGTMLDESRRRKHDRHLNEFLRKEPSYAKIGWIQDILSQEGYNDSANLLETAASRENDLWSKKVELCLSKLVNLAAAEDAGAASSPDFSQFDRQIALIDIQEILYSHITTHAQVEAAIDREAEIHLALEVFGPLTTDTKVLRSSLDKGLTTLLGHESLRVEQIIDLLTLMDPVVTLDAEDSDIVGHEFFLALQALHDSGVGDGGNRSRFEALERIIWRRCMIRDDWDNLNNTDMKDDSTVEFQAEETALYRTLKECFEAGFWRKDNAFLSPFQLFQPSKLLDADPFPFSIEDLYSIEERDLARADYEAEDESLREYVEKAQLDHWFEAAVNAAQLAVRSDADQAGEEEALKFVLKEEISRKENGDVACQPHGRHSTKGGAHPTNGDVEMEEVRDSSLVGAWVDG